MTSEIGAPLLGVLALAAASSSTPTIDVRGIGWLGLATTLLAALALYRAGSVRAWRETADAREARIADLERELAEIRTELKIPERIEGIVSLMSTTAVRQDDAARERLELALGEVRERWAEHDRAAETRTERLLAALGRGNE